MYEHICPIVEESILRKCIINLFSAEIFDWFVKNKGFSGPLHQLKYTGFFVGRLTIKTVQYFTTIKISALYQYSHSAAMFDEPP